MFIDRTDAGRQLARMLLSFKEEEPLVLALPRGGVPVALEVARALNAPLDVWVVRKVGAPGFEELGLGAVAEGGVLFLDRETLWEVGVTEEALAPTIARKRAEVAERAARFRAGRPPPDVTGRTVILVDDGIATGGTVRAAVDSLRAAHPRRIILAVPVAATQSLSALRHRVDEVVCLVPTPALYAIGAWYEDFSQVSDEEVVDLLSEARAAQKAPPQEPSGAAAAIDPSEVFVPIGGGRHLEGTLTLPETPVGLVLFAHGSGSSRFSPRNRHVAAVLAQRGVATLLLDLLTAQEEERDEMTGELRFDIPLLAERVLAATDWAVREPTARSLPIGYFGASTGAAAALIAAAERPEIVHAVVSRGGRPDLALDRLAEVRAPTLLIVGGRDAEVIDLNERAYARLRCDRELAIVPGATHLFEEPGTLDAVARLAADWFVRHLGAVKMATASAHASHAQ